MKDEKQSKPNTKDARQSNPITGPTAPKSNPAPVAPLRGRPLSRPEAKASRRADALFKALSTDYLLREQFVTDPAQIMAEYLAGRRLPEGAADVANQLLYSVMSNPRLRDWMAQYSMYLNGATPTRHAFAVQFARAVSTRGDALTTLALIRAATAGRDDFVVQADVLRALLTVIGGRLGSSGTEMSPGGGTERSPGGTEMSPGAIFSGTEMSPGGGTEMSPGAIFSGTEMSPGGGTERSPGGTEMSPGARFSGTEMSPGGGTERSPGGTEMSPGALGGRLPGYLQVTLTALVRYADQLRGRGALLSSGLEGR